MDMQKWTKLHEKLQISMKQEIGAMREMLANMHQEELSLISQDKNSWTKIMQERSILLERLCELRSMRLITTKELKSMADGQSSRAPASLESLFSPEDLNSCEIFSMRDQLMALMERMNQQNVRNQNLEGQRYHSTELDGPASSLPSKNRKLKAILATYPLKQ